MSLPIDFFSATATPTDTDTLLLLHMDGTDGSTAFVDSSIYTRTITATGSAQIDTAQSVFGTGSAYFTGNIADQLRIPDSSDFNLPAVDHTIEFWYRPASLADKTYALFTQWGDGGSNGSFYIYYYVSGATKRLSINVTQDGFVEDTHQQDITFLVNTWYAIAFERIGFNLYFYVNGTIIATASVTQVYYNSSRNLNVSGYADGSSADQAINGWIDELRFSKIARYGGANYTPATSAFTG